MQLVSTQFLIPTIYSELNGNGSQICQNRDNRRGCPVLATLKGKLVKV